MSEPTIQWEHPHPFILPVTVQPEHIDVMQHTNNVVYLEWVGQVAWAHSGSLGIDEAAFRAAGHGMVVRQHELTYLAATKLGDEVLLGTWLSDIDRLSMQRHYQFVRAKDGVTVFRGRTHFVCVDIEQGRVRRMPESFLKAYSAATELAEAASDTAQ